MAIIKLMILPFLACLVLVGIHSYLGIHVIKRKVIFVDLAFAQIAALGTTVAFLFGINPHSSGAYIFSLTFTFIGAAFFSFTRFRRGKIPQEAIIGLVYALAAAIAILVVDRAPHGAEHIKEILTGQLLWVKGSTVVKAAVVYLGVGIFHYIYRNKFMLITNDVEKAFQSGMSVRFWDFLFYTSFGLVITHSVSTAGILLVFIFLIVPAIIAISLTDKLLYQLIIGWGMGTLVGVAGLALSYVYDFPSGPAVVAFYGIALLIASVALYVFKSRGRSLLRALSNVLLGILMITTVAVGYYFMGCWMSKHPEWSGFSIEPQTDIESNHPAKSLSHANIISTLKSMDLIDKENYLKRIGDKNLLIRIIADAGNDDEIRLQASLRLFALNKRAAAPSLVYIMKRSKSPLFRDEAVSKMRKLSKRHFGYDPFSQPDDLKNKQALSAWQKWLISDDNSRK